jgi:general secretion pathway protein A
MYREYFGLKEKPFTIAPNTHYFYMSDGHREALAHLLYGIKGEGGFVLLTGEVGTGKTTVCRVLLELMPEDLEIAFLLNPPFTVEELLAAVCDEFGIKYPSDNTSVKDFVARIHAYLLDVHARGRRPILIVEEAQNLSTEVLEQIRLLTNLETNEYKLLQIIMIGQPELRDKLRQPELRQLSQRITARYHLGPLSKRDIPEYVNFRLATAGLKRRQPLFPARTVKKLYGLTGGVPRLINSICDRALLGAYVEGRNWVDTKTLRTAAHEVFGNGKSHFRGRKVYQGLAGVCAMFVCVGLAATYLQKPEPVTIEETRAVTDEQRVKADPAGPVEAVSEELSDYARFGTKESAYETLFKVWQIDYQQERRLTVCEQAKEQGLRCFEGTGGTASELREKNRPAVLHLHDKNGTSYYVTLTALRGETVTCVVGNETKMIELTNLVKEWSGEYLFLWRLPSDYKGKLRPGKRGPMVAWLDRQLALAQGRTVRPGLDQVYNQEIADHVKEFQRSRGLTPDGIAGLGTILKLTAAAGNGEPALDEVKASN